MKQFKNITLRHLRETQQFIDDKKLLESPIENMFHDQLFKYKGEDVQLIPQYNVKTISGNFRLDFALEHNGSKIGIECDGKEFHEDDWYDEWRDSLILVSSDIQSIFRLHGKDIYSYISDLIYFIAKKEPNYFSFNLIERLSPAVLKEVRDYTGIHDHIDKKRIIFEILTQDERPVNRIIEIVWRNIEKSFDKYYLKEILYSFIFPGKSIEELKKILDEKHYDFNELIEMYNRKYPNDKLKNKPSENY